MHKTSIRLILGTLVAPLAAINAAEEPAVAGKAATAAKPNIVVILADDLGYGDVQCYNRERGKIPTPNIDRLATQGMQFTDAHSSSGVCSPSRYTLLTGRYHWRTRLQMGIVSVFGDPLIAPDRLTIAGLAKRQGYRTAAIGKWHLGWDWPVPAAQRLLLQAPPGAGNKDDEAPVEPTAEALAAWRELFSQPIPGGPTTRGFDTYFGTDVPNWPPYCFIENNRTVGIPLEFLPSRFVRKQPLMASLPGPAVKDWTFEPILPALAERAGEFVTREAKSGRPFLLYMPLTAPHEPLAVTQEWRGRSGLNVYADFVMQTDAVVGRVLQALEQSGVAGNTLVIFTSDNGKASYTGAAELEKRGHFSSGPLRGYKTSVYEGGHREPFIVRWPGAVKAGSVCGQLVQQADLLATIAEILGTKLPPNAGEDSFSILPLLRGADHPVREQAVNCASSGVPALRQGPWKLILGAEGNAPPEVQLYNLADDLGETRNLAGEQPARVAQMRATLERLIVDGRSTPGAPQQNDVEVIRYPKRASDTPKTRKTKK